MNHMYKLSYRIESHTEGIPRQEAIDRSKLGYSSCDAVLIASIVYPADGSQSITFVGIDGRGGTLDDNEWFKVLAMLSSQLSQSTTLDASKREFCELVWSTLTSPALQATTLRAEA